MKAIKYLLLACVLVAGMSILSVGVAVADKFAVKQPKIPFQYSLGVNKYRQMCAGCHGKWGGGTDQGPPLMHGIYKPSHHRDSTFYRAVLKGSQAHHWKFGDMPSVKGATKEDVDAILPFIRWLQRENGIYK